MTQPRRARRTLGASLVVVCAVVSGALLQSGVFRAAVGSPDSSSSQAAPSSVTASDHASAAIMARRQQPQRPSRALRLLDDLVAGAGCLLALVLFVTIISGAASAMSLRATSVTAPTRGPPLRALT